MNKIIHFIINRPKWIFSIVVGLTLLFGFGLAKLETQTDMTSDLPEDDPMVMTKNRIEDVFGKKDMVLIGIKADNIFTAGTLQKIQEIEEELKDIEGILPDEVTSIVSVNNITGHEDGVDVGLFIPEIPTDKLTLDALRESATSNELIINRIISEDGTFSAIVASIENGYVEAYVHGEVTKIVEKHKNPETIYIARRPDPTAGNRPGHQRRHRAVASPCHAHFAGRLCVYFPHQNGRHPAFCYRTAQHRLDDGLHGPGGL